MNVEFRKQEENITKLIDENFQITIAELNKSKYDIKELKNEINGSKTSSIYRKWTKVKIESLEKKHETFCVKVYDSQTYPKFVQSKLINLENRSRRNNVSIYGVTERNYET